MKESKIIENLLTFLLKYDGYYIKHDGNGIYRIENILTLQIPNLSFPNFGNRVVTINLNNNSISYAVSNYGNEHKRSDTVVWAEHIENVTKQLADRVRGQLDYDIRAEDALRLRKSRECRVNRKLMSLTEVT